MDDETPGPAPEYSLVMPFVVCEDQGGPFEGGAFVAGWNCGVIDAALQMLRPLGITELRRYVDTRIVPQLDLSAMQHGFKMLAKAWDEHPDEWTLVEFTPCPPLSDVVK